MKEQFGRSANNKLNGDRHVKRSPNVQPKCLDVWRRVHTRYRKPRQPVRARPWTIAWIAVLFAQRDALLLDVGGANAAAVQLQRRRDGPSTVAAWHREHLHPPPSRHVGRRLLPLRSDVRRAAAPRAPPGTARPDRLVKEPEADGALPHWVALRPHRLGRRAPRHAQEGGAKVTRRHRQ